MRELNYVHKNTKAKAVADAKYATVRLSDNPHAAEFSGEVCDEFSVVSVMSSSGSSLAVAFDAGTGIGTGPGAGATNPCGLVGGSVAVKSS